LESKEPEERGTEEKDAGSQPQKARRGETEREARGKREGTRVGQGIHHRPAGHTPSSLSNGEISVGESSVLERLN